MRQILLFFACLLLFLPLAKADHVAGYDMILINIKNPNGTPSDNYKFRIKFYRDRLGIPIPTGFNITIYKNSPNEVVAANIPCPKINAQLFLTFPPEDCAPKDAQLQTEMGIYETAPINMASYSSAGGYYATANICCRNIGITNVAGNSSTYSLGMVCEFPRLNAGSTTRYNSSPDWTEYPLTIFCLGRPYTLNWDVIDPDGDSLAFSMAVPIDQSGLKPFELVDYAAGYNVNYNIIDGVPDISIHPKTGVINFIPTRIGKYLVAFKCEEFRNGVKIGETRREYQLESIDCKVAPPITEDNSNQKDLITDTLDYGQPYVLTLTSRDSPQDSLFMSIIPNKNENILDPSLFGAKWGEQGAPLGGGSAQNLVISETGTVIGEFLWTPACRHVREQPYTFTVVVRDQTCPAPFYDTTVVRLFVRKKPNLIPFFVLPDTITKTSPINVSKRTYFVNAGDRFQLDADSIIITYDQDSTQVVDISMIPDPANGNINTALSFTATPAVVHSTAVLRWDTRCEDRRETPYKITIRAKDNDCARPDTVQFELEIYVKDAPNVQPEIKESSIATYHIPEGQSLQLSFTAIDSIRDPKINRFRQVSLVADSADFIQATQGVMPSFVSTPASDSSTMNFSWTPNCYNIRTEPYRLRITATDDGCPIQRDAYEVLIFVDPSINNAPQLLNNSAQSLPDTLIVNRFYDEPAFRLDFTAIDTNTRFDSIYVYADQNSEIFNANIVEYPAVVVEKSGKDSVKSYFEWRTDCFDIRNDFYELKLFARDNQCITPAVDTVVIRIKVSERPNFVPEFSAMTKALIPSSGLFETVAADSLIIELAAYDTLSTSMIYIDQVYNNIPANFPQPEIQRVYGNGNDTLRTQFKWLLDCSLIRDEPYTIRIATWDEACRQPADSSALQFQVRVNKNPELFPILNIVSDTIELVAGDQYNLEIIAESLRSSDSIFIQASGDIFGGIPGNWAQFVQSQSIDKGIAQLTWQSSCDQIREELYFADIATGNAPCLSDTDQVRLYFKIIPNTDLTNEIPNVFTPNGDLINDSYSINQQYKVYCDPEFRFSIFNRWGTKVFESVNPDFEWKPEATIGVGTYFYTLESRARTQSGTINLIR